MTVGDWEQFEDWCTAAGQPALPTTWAAVQEFLADVPGAPSTVRRRLGAIRARHATARAALSGAPTPAPVPTPWHTPGELIDPDVEDGPRWLDLGEALHQLPVHGHPHGVTARRDAVVLVLAARGWSRRRITALVPDRVYTEPVTGIDQVDVPMTNHGLTCPSCALTRWLRVLATEYDTSGPVEDSVERLVDAHPVDVRVHDCATPVPQAWRQAPHLLPVVDRYGRIEHGSVIPLRRVTAITGTRQRPDTPIAQGRSRPVRTHPARPAPTPAERARQIHEIDEALDTLDAAIADADRHWHVILSRLEQ
ncbi:hypothetical protein [Leekyejoonella antrihumi]|uniref:Core-binding (CB) domain-containing protein n=1 Tax=Leekyejoonella antrihumi TaxID=1660198 RepID=A0A563DSG0_9MICO|nr:hypothetical protein [Leekyejoonella antrihumi]TWP33180.1 hypothetical protein FGL98_22175 [Leekyejoonella antrihumi]